RAVERALRALHFDALGAAVAAALGQLVADVVDAMGIGALVALQALGDHAHPGILVTHAAGGDIGRRLVLEFQAVGAQELVSPAQRDVAFAGDVFAIDAAHVVAGDVGGLRGPFLRRSDR